MTPTLQIVVDCSDPHHLAHFWAAAAGYEVEDHHEHVRRAVDAGYTTVDESALEIDGRLAWRDAAACSSPEPGRPRLLFQVVPEPKTAKNRVHLDLDVGAEHRDAEVERLLALGATKLWEGQQGPNRWVTLADPEGNEFCVG